MSEPGEALQSAAEFTAALAPRRAGCPADSGLPRRNTTKAVGMTIRPPTTASAESNIIMISRSYWREHRIGSPRRATTGFTNCRNTKFESWAEAVRFCGDLDTIRAMLRLARLALRRGPNLLLEDVTLQVHAGQKVGVTGANGSGKSSLFSLLLGELGPDSGDCEVPANWVIAHVEQQTPSGSRAAIEYVLDGDSELRRIENELAAAQEGAGDSVIASLHAQLDAADGYTARSRGARLLHGLGFTAADIERPVDAFSGGWRMRLGLAKALMCRSDLLLLDEPTNHLDLDAVIWLEGWLRAYPGTLLLISHDRDFLDSVAENIVHLERGHVTLYPGNYSAFERIRAERLAHQQSQFEKQQRDIAHIRSYVDRFRAKKDKARQAQSRLKALQRMELIAPAHVDSPFRFRMRAPEKIPSPLLRLDNVAAGYGTKTVIESVRCDLVPGDRIGLLGANGAGKSTLIKLLAGVLAPLGGECEPARELRVGYFAQHQVDQLDPAGSPLEHLTRIDPKAKEAELRGFLGGFGFSAEKALLPTAPFSGGEKSRLALALLVYQRPNLLLLDEPTNHLDLEMRQALAVALQDFSGAMVIVSHDRHLLRVSTDQLWLVSDARVSEFKQSLDDYPAWLAQRARGEGVDGDTSAAANGAATRKQRRREEAEIRKKLSPLRRRLEKAEAALSELHAQESDLTLKLGDAGIYNAEDKSALRALLETQRNVKRALCEQEEEWMAACEALEALESAQE